MHFAVLAAALAAVACSTAPPNPLPSAQCVDDGVTKRSSDEVGACLATRLDGPVAEVAGITPTTTATRWPGGFAQAAVRTVTACAPALAPP
jgi:hypothetical protein